MSSAFRLLQGLVASLAPHAAGGSRGFGPADLKVAMGASGEALVKPCRVQVRSPGNGTRAALQGPGAQPWEGQAGSPAFRCSWGAGAGAAPAGPPRSCMGGPGAGAAGYMRAYGNSPRC